MGRPASEASRSFAALLRFAAAIPTIKLATMANATTASPSDIERPLMKRGPDSDVKICPAMRLCG